MAAAAAVLAKTEYGVEDEEILSAIRCHTTGKPHMSKLDKVLYLADMASYERTYPEAATLRQHALQNLDKTMVEALGMSISWLKETANRWTSSLCRPMHSFVQSFTEDTPVEQRQTLRQAPRQIDISRARRRGAAQAPAAPCAQAAARPRHPRPWPGMPPAPQRGKRRRSKGKKALVASAGVLCALCLCAGGFYLYARAKLNGGNAAVQNASGINELVPPELQEEQMNILVLGLDYDNEQNANEAELGGAFKRKPHGGYAAVCAV